MTERHGLTTEDGQHIDPERLHEAAKRAGIIDAENGRYVPESFFTVGAKAAYTEGHKIGSMRQPKPWGGRGWANKS